jgi:hypothetical protein
MKPFERAVLLVFALLVIYSSIDLLNYSSWTKFYLGVALIGFSFVVLFIVFKSFFNHKK